MQAIHPCLNSLNVSPIPAKLFKTNTYLKDIM